MNQGISHFSALEALSTFAKSQRKVALLELIAALFIAALGLGLIVIHSNLALQVVGAVIFASGQIKIFSIQHDCGHYSFSGSRRLDGLVGRLCSILTLIPFNSWRIEHNRHHNHFCDFNQHTLGDVYLLSEEQFQIASPFKKAAYRAFRSRIFIFAFAPLLYLVFRNRLALKANNKQVLSTHLTTVCLLALYAPAIYLSPSMALPLLLAFHLAGTFGMVIFYNEHQYQGSRWSTKESWSLAEACMHGSSVIHMPRLFSWLTGNIGYHNLHHLSPRIPSYKLRSAYEGTKHLIPSHVIPVREMLFPFRCLVWSAKEGRLVEAH